MSTADSIVAFARDKKESAPLVNEPLAIRNS